MVWTNEKHNSYLEFLETSFVEQLHYSMRLRGCYPQEEMWEPCPTPQLPAKVSNSSHQVRDLLCLPSSPYGFTSINCLVSISYLDCLFSFRFSKMAATWREMTRCWIALLILVISWLIHYIILHLLPKLAQQHFLFREKLLFPRAESAREVIQIWVPALLVHLGLIC